MTNFRSVLLCLVCSFLFCLTSFVAQAQEVRVIPRQKSIIKFKDVVVGNEGLLIASTFYYQKTISVFEGITGKELIRIPIDDNLRSFFFTADDKKLLIVYWDKITVFDIVQNKLTGSTPLNFYILYAGFNAKTCSLAVASVDSVYTFNLQDSHLAIDQRFAAERVQKIKFSADAKRVYTGTENQISIWDRVSGQKKNVITVDNLINFAVTETAVIALSQTPSAYHYYDLDGNSAGAKREFKRAVPSYPAEVLPMGNYFAVQSFNVLDFADNEGHEWTIKTKDNFQKVQLSKFLGAYVLTGTQKIRTINDDGNPLSELTDANYLHQDMAYFPPTKKYIFLGDSLLQFTIDGKTMHRHTLSAKYAGINKVINGILLLTCVDGSVEVWDLAKETLVYKVKHTHIPYDLAFDAESKMLYVADMITSSVYQYHLPDNAAKVICKEDAPITALLLQGKKIYYGNSSGTITMAEVPGDKFIKSKAIKILSNSITTINSIKGDVLFSSFGRTVALKNDLSDSTDSRVFVGHNGYITALSSTRNGDFFATASPDKSIKLWDFDKQRMLRSYDLDSVSADRLQFIEEKDTVSMIFYGPGYAIGGIDDIASIRDAKKPSSHVVVQSPNNNAPLKLVINKQGDLLASTDDNTVKVRDLKTGFLVSEFSTRDKVVNGITFTGDGKMLAVATGNGIECFDPVSGTSIRQIDLKNRGGSIHDVEAINNVILGINIHGWHNPLYFHKNSGLSLGQFYYNEKGNIDKRILDLKFSNDGTLAATFGSNYVKIFGVVNGNFLEKLAIPLTQPGKAYEGMDLLDISPDGKYLMYTEFTDATHVGLKIVRTADGTAIRSQPGYLGKFGKDGNYIRMISKDHLAFCHLDNDVEDIVDAHFDVRVRCMAYNLKADVFAVADDFGNIKMIEGKYGIVTNEIDRWDQYTYNTEMSPDHKFVVFNNRWGLYLLDMKNLTRETLPGNNYPFIAAFSPASDKIYSAGKTNVFSKDLISGKTDTLFNSGLKGITGVDVSKDGKTVIVHGDADEVVIFDVNTRKQLWKLNKKEVPGFSSIHIYGLEGGPDAPTLFAAGFKTYATTSEVSITPIQLEMPSLKLKRTLAPELKYKVSDSTGFAKVVFERDVRVNHFSPGKTYHAYMKDLKFYVTDVVKNKLIFTRDNPVNSSIEYVQFDPEEKKMLLGFSNGEVEIYDLTQQGDDIKYGDDAKGLKRLQVLKTNANGINSMRLYDDLLLVNGKNEMASLFDLKNNNEKLLDMVFIKNRDQIFIDKDGYYFTTKNAAKYLAFKQGTSILPFESFDYTYNRPDKVMAALAQRSLVSPELVSAYQNAYQKRIAKGAAQDLNELLPTVKVDDDKLKQVQYQQNIMLPISASGFANNLSALQIMVNGVPYFGSKGKAISGKAWKGDITLPLSAGANTIKVSVLNDRNIGSYPQTLFINYTSNEKVKPDLHIIAVSVSDYQSDHDLAYPQKDGRDIVAAFSQKDKYQNIYTDTLFNKAATRANFLALKSKLMKTKPDDRVIVFFSGHGLLDKKYNFYFATYDCDFNDPAAKGLSYSAIEGLLDSVPARKKILFLDACHSGEFDKDSKQTASLLASNVRSTYRESGKGGGVANIGLGLENSYLLMQDLFGNLSKGSGTVVISAAAGDSYALESDKWHNGVFTYAILSGLKDLSADLDHNKTITASELRDYVYQKVSTETGGRQKPTTRQENLDFDWAVW